MPRKFYFSTENRTVEYIYRADGTKLEAVYNNKVPAIAIPAAENITNDKTPLFSMSSFVKYIANAVYLSMTPDKIYFDGGYVKYNPGSKTYEYYYYIQDHLNSNRAVVKEDGTLIQAADYLASGIATSEFDGLSKDNRLHTGKEFDSMHGLNLYDNQARMYDPIYGKFTGIDPLADHPKQIAWSPYAHCANNPLKYFDLDGKKFVFAKGSTQQFKAQAREAVRYLQKNKADGILINVHKHEKTVFLAEIKNDGYFDVSSNTIYWDPKMSPTTILNHELDHANQEITNPDQKTKDRSTTDTKYKNKEEKRVIEGSEQTTAKKLGEIKDGEKTRSDHYGKAYETKGSTTTEGKNDIIINGKEYEK